MSFLTVVPAATADGAPGTRLGRAYFPLIGALVGLAAGAVFAVLTLVSTPLVSAVLAVATLVLLTGALHLDGVADAADGLLGKGDVEQRLASMRDPRVGVYGAAAVVLVLLGEVAALSGMSARIAIVALVVAGAASRLAMLAVVAYVPYVRTAGLGVAATGDHRRFDVLLGTALTLIACLLDFRHALLGMLFIAITSLAIVALARRRIGGATGDVYGAVAEVGQLAALVAFTFGVG